MFDFEPLVYDFAPPTEVTDLVAMTTAILSIPTTRVGEVDAFCVLPGVAGQVILKHALVVWKTVGGRPMLAIAGYHEEGKACADLSVENFTEKFGFPRTGVPIYSQVCTGNTPGQTEWLAEIIEENKWKSVALFAPASHMRRAYLTLLKSLMRRGLTVVIIPMVTVIPPTARLPIEVGKNGHQTTPTQMTLVPCEDPRTVAYQAKGDIASRQELEEYLEWMYEQPIIRYEYGYDLTPMGYSRR